MSDGSEIANNGVFWHFLAIFRVENGQQITLLVFDILFFTQMLYIIEVDTKMLKIIVLKWGHIGTVLVFENLLVRYLGQKFSKLSFFNHIWSHLPGVNGFLLEPFMTCNNFCHSLWGVNFFPCVYKSQNIFFSGQPHSAVLWIVMWSKNVMIRLFNDS